MQIKSGDVDRFVAKPSPDFRVVLFFGPDAGLVSERAERFVEAVVGDTADPFARVRLDADTLEAGRLADEAYAVSMFGGRRAIRLRVAGSRSVAAAIEPLIAQPPTDAWLAVEAGDLRKTAPLRKLIEGARNAAAIGCYTDSGRALDALIASELGAAGLSIDPAAVKSLRQLLGDDRLSARSELHKLASYAAGERSVTAEMVRLSIGDAAELEVDDLVDQVAAADSTGADRSFRRLRATGTDASVIAGALLRHLQQIHRLRGEIERGRSLDSALDAASPPVFFKRRPAVHAQVEAWQTQAVEDALEAVNTAISAARLAPGLADAIIGRAFAVVGRLASIARR